MAMAQVMVLATNGLKERVAIAMAVLNPSMRVVRSITDSRGSNRCIVCAYAKFKDSGSKLVRSATAEGLFD